MPDHRLTVEQLQEILAHDGPTDIWLLEQDGSITVVPDQPIDEFQNPSTWPKYLARSGSIDNIVLGQGYEPALRFVNFTITTLIIGGSIQNLAANAGRRIAAALPGRRLRTGATK
ncbi:hypothetical protein [Rhodococcus sp. MEB064]|uniref:hypothetical protein n=1 Tax=Rhodococcus sp. MEB064 TaxID=1587522 RepID=UPI0005AC8ABC|nr:hypothetical protein [Rhodococcus sp. MEB064]KIQ15345.1 hypothetical protein RU01_15570 [Rhodococcus sp. MEB064]